jgi:hypothetical protein
MHNVYTVFDYGVSGPPAQKSATAGPSRGFKQAAASAGPRVGLGDLTAAEKAAAQAAFDKGLASKSSDAGSDRYRLVSLQVFLVLLAIYTAS